MEECLELEGGGCVPWSRSFVAVVSQGHSDESLAISPRTLKAPHTLRNPESPDRPSVRSDANACAPKARSESLVSASRRGLRGLAMEMEVEVTLNVMNVETWNLTFRSAFVMLIPFTIIIAEIRLLERTPSPNAPETSLRFGGLLCRAAMMSVVGTRVQKAGPDLEGGG